MKHSIILHNAQQGHAALAALWQFCKPHLIAERKLVVSVREETRSTAQNALMWSCLTDIASQVQWPVDGVLSKLDPEDWKHIISAGLKREMRVAQGISGGWVMLGQKTSRMSKAQMSEMIDLCHAFGDQNGVKWSATSIGQTYE